MMLNFMRRNASKLGVLLVVSTMFISVLGIFVKPVYAAYNYENNVVEDWNFELGGDAWNQRNAGNISNTVSSNEGTYSGCIPPVLPDENGNVSGYIGQVVTVPSNEYYLLHCDAKVDIAGAKVMIVIRANDDQGELIREMPVTETDWQPIEFMIDTGKNSKLLIQLVKWAETSDSFYEATRDCNAYIDGVALAPRTANPINPSRPPIITPTLPDESEFTQMWRDDFDNEELNSNDWGYELGSIRGVEQQHYSNSKDNVFIRDGKLVLKATDRPKEYQYKNPRGQRQVIYDSGSVRTHGKREFLYGKIEISAKLPKGQGVFPAFWTLGSDFTIDGDIAVDQGYGWPRCGEIDIMELIGEGTDSGNGNKVVYGTAHTYGKWDAGEDHKLAGVTYRNPSDEPFNNDFHTFGINWSPNELTWYVDGKAYFTAKYNDDELAQRSLNRPQYIQLNLAMGGNWPGDVGTNLDGTEFAIDYVSYSQTEEQKLAAKEYYKSAPKLSGVKDVVMVQGENPDLLSGVTSFNDSFVDFSVENGLEFKPYPDNLNQSACTSVDLVCTSKDYSQKLASLPVGKYNIHYTAIPNGMKVDQSGQPDREENYRFDRKTATLIVKELSFPSNFELIGYEGEKLSLVQLPEGWLFVDPTQKIVKGENTAIVIYKNSVTKEVSFIAKTSADKTLLIEKLNVAEKEFAKTDIYTKDSLDNLLVAINNSKGVLADLRATEIDITDAIADISNKIAFLVKSDTEKEPKIVEKLDIKTNSKIPNSPNIVMTSVKSGDDATLLLTGLLLLTAISLFVVIKKEN